MTEIEAIGTFFLYIVPVLISVAALVKPIMKLTETMTVFNDNVKLLFANDCEHKHRLDNHGDRLDNHENRIVKVETEVEHLKTCPIRNERS